MTSSLVRWLVLLAFAASAQVSCCWRSAWFTGGWESVGLSLVAEDAPRCCGCCEKADDEVPAAPVPCKDCGKAGLKDGLPAGSGGIEKAAADLMLLPVLAVGAMLPAAAEPARPARCFEEAETGPPRTLLALHCALIV